MVTTSEKIGLAAATTCFVLAIISATYIFRDSSTFEYNLAYLSFSAGYVFVASVLLLNKRGALLLAAVSLLAVTPAICTIITLTVYMPTSPLGIFYMSLSSLTLDFFVLIGFVVYFEIRKEAQDKGWIPRLWYVPGLLSSMSFSTALTHYMILMKPDMDMQYLAVDVIMPGLLGIVFVFLLGYRVCYIYTISTAAPSEQAAKVLFAWKGLRISLIAFVMVFNFLYIMQSTPYLRLIA